MIGNRYLFGLVGGLLIGLAGAAYLLGNGRILGARAIIGGLIDGSGRADWRDRFLFVAGLIAAPWLAITWLGLTPTTHIKTNPTAIVVAGLLVAAGSRLANGCTGLCGIWRPSLRGSPRGLSTSLPVASAFSPSSIV